MTDSCGHRELVASGCTIGGAIGRTVEDILQQTGQICQIFWGKVTALFTGKISLRSVVREMYTAGVQSLPIVLVGQRLVVAAWRRESRASRGCAAGQTLSMIPVRSWGGPGRTRLGR